MHCSILPALSFFICIISIVEFSLRRRATPELFGMGPECQIDLPVHSLFHFLIDSVVEWVSCSSVISLFLLFNKSYRLCRFLSSCSPFMFRVVIGCRLSV